jgi:hypothetical protein
VHAGRLQKVGFDFEREKNVGFCRLPDFKATLHIFFLVAINFEPPSVITGTNEANHFN